MTDPIPGFTPEQSWALRTVARQAAQETVAELATRSCPAACEDMAAVKATLFGATERGIVGIDARMDTAEGTLATIRRLTWLVVGAVVVSLISLVFTIGQLAAAAAQTK